MKTASPDTLTKVFEPANIESRWYQYWEQNHYFKPSNQGDAYCIILPPPNVTGTLHMGHGFQLSLMDALTRFHRMDGRNTLWQVGTDHAGIATQIVVEKQLQKQNLTRHDLGRDRFVERVWEWKNLSDGTIKKQLRRMGASFDWSRECFSLDDNIAAAVRKVFVQLHDEGLIYRGKRLVNWDPTLLTAVSDLEVVTEEESGKLWHFRYPINDSNEHIIIATTRPETMFGDVAIAIHPDDERYQQLIGKTALQPLANRNIPIIADDFVEPEFGSGCVKITPAHDFDDYEVGLRHQLEMINIFTPEAKLNENVPEKYQGLDRFEARKLVVKDLEEKNLVEKIENYQVKLPRGDRSGAVVEPYLTSQWYVKTKPLAEAAINAVKQGEVRFIPENWSNTYYRWLEDIQDWCISRQLWWGHRIPAWYDEEQNVYVGDDEADVRKKYQLADSVQLTQDDDVLDTWFSASLWPMVTLGWPEKTPEFDTFYPTNTLVTGFDIIFFWVARMIMMGLKFTGKSPFAKVYITGLIRDSEGKKMSKSKGNILDPIDLIDGVDLNTLIEKRTGNMMTSGLVDKITKSTKREFPEGIAAYGTDALRFTYCALASTGRDIRFDMGRIEGYRNFCNKIWNAARYILMNTEGQDNGFDNTDVSYSLADRWIRTELQHTITRVRDAFAAHRFDLLAQAVYEFTWNEYCDWYLELSKPVLTDDSADAALQRGTRQTLLYVFENLLRLIHPIMPYITEEIWQKIAPLCDISAETIMLQPYPVVSDEQIDEAAFNSLEWLKQVIIAIRNIRGEMNISPNKEIPLLLQKGNNTDRSNIEDNQRFLMKLAKLTDIQWLDNDVTPPASATAVVNDLELHIPMADLIDKDAELQRLSKELQKIEKQLQASQAKLANENYTAKAPADVVAQERQRVADMESLLKKLKEQQQRIQAL